MKKHLRKYLRGAFLFTIIFLFIVSFLSLPHKTLIVFSLRVINSCVMTINLTNGVSKDVDFATDDVRATVDNRPNLKKKCRFGRFLLCDNCPNLKKNCRFGWLLLYLQQ